MSSSQEEPPDGEDDAMDFDVTEFESIIPSSQLPKNGNKRKNSNINHDNGSEVKKANQKKNKKVGNQNGGNIQTSIPISKDTSDKGSPSNILQSSSSKQSSKVAEKFEKVNNSAKGAKAVLNNVSEVGKAEVVSDFYSEDNQGPFGVWVKKSSDDNNGLSAYVVGSILFKEYRSIQSIKNKNKFKVEVIFKKKEEANHFLANKSGLQQKNNIESFVPGFRKSRKGIIKNIPVELDKDQILMGIESDAVVLDIKRLNRRNYKAVGENDKWIPSQSVMVVFSGQTLPREISIYKVKTEVNPFVSNPMQCYNCFAFGHTAKTCKNVKSCIMCGEDDHPDKPCSTTDIPRCKNCKENHKSNDYNCPLYLKQKEINVLMAFDNMTFFEAKKIVYSDLVRPPNKTRESYPAMKSNISYRYSQALGNKSTPFNGKQSSRHGSSVDPIHTTTGSTTNETISQTGLQKIGGTLEAGGLTNKNHSLNSTINSLNSRLNSNGEL